MSEDHNKITRRLLTGKISDDIFTESVKIRFLCDERDIISVKSEIARKIFQGLKIVTKTVVLLDTDEYKTTRKLD